MTRPQADGLVTDGVAEIDESLLTGESDLISKRAGETIFSGSFCVTGELIYRATAVGRASFAGQLTTQARQATNVATPLQQQVTLVVRLLMTLTVILALLFYITGFILNLTFLQDIKGSAVLVGLIPYGLFLTISLAYTLGAVKLARAGALVQHNNAVEALYYVDVLCMDKTGTLTANALQLHAVQPIGDLDVATVQQWLGNFVHSASTTNPTNEAIRKGLDGRVYPVGDEVRFASARKWSALVFAQNGTKTPAKGGEPGVFVLGALEMLHPYLAPQSATTEAALAQQVTAWSAQGLRVLLFAYHPTATTLHDATGAPILPPLQPRRARQFAR